MICPRCNNVVQDGAMFCRYCGMPLSNTDTNPTASAEAGSAFAGEETVSPVYPEAKSAVYEEPAVTVQSGAFPDVQLEAEADYGAEAEAEKPKRKAIHIILPIVLGVLLLAAAAFAVIFALRLSEADEAYDKVYSELKTVKAERDDLKEELADNDEQLTQLEEYSYALDEIAYFAQYSNCGYSSENFHVDKSIVYLDEDNTSASITLTTTFSGGASISMDSYGSGADADFTEDTWGDTTTISIKRDASALDDGEIGITTLTFSNDVNSETFDVLIIVMG